MVSPNRVASFRGERPRYEENRSLPPPKHLLPQPPSSTAEDSPPLLPQGRAMPAAGRGEKTVPPRHVQRHPVPPFRGKGRGHRQAGLRPLRRESSLRSSCVQRNHPFLLPRCPPPQPPSSTGENSPLFFRKKGPCPLPGAGKRLFPSDTSRGILSPPFRGKGRGHRQVGLHPFRRERRPAFFLCAENRPPPAQMPAPVASLLHSGGQPFLLPQEGAILAAEHGGKIVFPSVRPEASCPPLSGGREAVSPNRIALFYEEKDPLHSSHVQRNRPFLLPKHPPPLPKKAETPSPN